MKERWIPKPPSGLNKWPWGSLSGMAVVGPRDPRLPQLSMAWPRRSAERQSGSDVPMYSEAGDVVQLVDCLPSMHKALGSIPALHNWV